MGHEENQNGTLARRQLYNVPENTPLSSVFDRQLGSRTSLLLEARQSALNARELLYQYYLHICTTEACCANPIERAGELAGYHNKAWNQIFSLMGGAITDVQYDAATDYAKERLKECELLDTV